jgi:16S rRNA (guanine966-N2)-methyltransferase
MRISGGVFRGRIIKTTPGLKVRPTADKVRQANFNIMKDEIEGAVVLDLFAGSGALGIEALSRGASRAVFVESDRVQAGLIRKNLAFLEIKGEIITNDYQAAGRRLSGEGAEFDLILADPPYHKIMPSAVLEMVERYGLLRPGGLLIIEHKKIQATESGRLKLLKRSKFGQTEVSFYVQE